MSGEGALPARRPLIEAPLEFRLRSGGSLSKDSALITCAKCDAPAFIRKSTRVTETVKHMICHCTDSGCGHIFRMELVFVHTLVPGLIPRPDLNLPVCPVGDVPHVRPPATRDEDDEQTTLFDTG